MVTESNAPDADIARMGRGSRPGGRASIAIKRWRDNAFTSTRDGIVQKTLSGENGRSRKGNAPIAGNIFMKSRSQGIGVRTRGKASVAVQNDRQGAVCQNSQCPADFVRKHKEALRMMLSGSARKPSEGSQETHRKPYTPAHRRYLCMAYALYILAHTWACAG